jgi:PAS domain S-box-containing protein
MKEEIKKKRSYTDSTEIDYSKTLDYLLEGCQIIGFDWRYLYLNDVAAKHGHKTKEELLGRTMMEAYPDIEKTGMFSMLRDSMNNRNAHQVENEFTYPDGTKGWFELRIDPVPSGIFIFSIDISEQKKFAQKIQHVNSILKSLRSINQLITKEKNPEVLIRESCEIMVKNRGFASIWVLLVDDKKKFKYASAAGNKEINDAFLEQLKKGIYPICFKEILAGEKLFAFCDTFLNKENICMLNCSQGNCRGFICRLEYNGKVFGAIAAYLPAIMANDPEEMRLFEDLAEDISFALHNSELEESHKKAEDALQVSETLYRSLFENMLNGFAYCKMLFDDGKPSDFIYLMVNKTFETQTGLKNVTGKKVSEIIPGIQEEDPDLLDIYGSVAMTGEPRTFEIYIKSLSMWFSVSVYSPEKGYFVAIFDMITERKNSEEALAKSNLTLKKNLYDVIDTMCKIVEMRDPYTAGHQKRVARLAVSIAKEMGMDNQKIDLLDMAATIHDVGKIYIPPSILTKPGTLTDIEFQFIKTHAAKGYDIIKGIDFDAAIGLSVLQHHEKLDGSGYPNGLKGKDICLEARILAVADTVEAMASHRPYRSALGIKKALEEINSNRGIKYDEAVVDACQKIFKKRIFAFGEEEHVQAINYM